MVRRVDEAWRVDSAAVVTTGEFPRTARATKEEPDALAILAISPLVAELSGTSRSRAESSPPEGRDGCRSVYENPIQRPPQSTPAQSVREIAAVTLPDCSVEIIPPEARQRDLDFPQSSPGPSATAISSLDVGVTEFTRRFVYSSKHRRVRTPDTTPRLPPRTRRSRSPRTRD